MNRFLLPTRHLRPLILSFSREGRRDVGAMPQARKPSPLAGEGWVRGKAPISNPTILPKCFNGSTP